MRTLLIAVLLAAAVPSRAALDGAALSRALGRPVAGQNGEFKVSVPRTDLSVSVDGFRIVPAMGLTAWLAFAPHGEAAMLMGDLVLTEGELPRVQKAAVAAGLSVSAIHNHFLRDEPKVMFMHVGGVGRAEDLAASARKVLDAFAPKPAAPAAARSSLDGAALDALVGHKGADDSGVHKIVIGRPDVVVRHGAAALDAFMGLNTWMAFQGTPERAAVAGDFAMLAPEVDGVIAALVAGGVQVAAVHNHMTVEEPRVVFLHFWGVGPAADLAKTLRAALDKTASDAEKP
ncbi:MAG: DUF1259 domain-containing protein [Elusimicrobia bacterium]|nr:DUF1259 domain-containing protein [Elusimicrobiota bacterium]